MTKASRSEERTGRKKLILPWKTGRKTGELSDGAASGRCRLRRSLVAAVMSPSAPSANAFWGKGFRLLSYVQQAQTAKRFAKGSLPASSVRRRRRRRRLQPSTSPNPEADEAGCHRRAPPRLSLPTLRASLPSSRPQTHPSLSLSLSPDSPRSSDSTLHNLKEVAEGEKGGSEGDPRSLSPASTFLAPTPRASDPI